MINNKANLNLSVKNVFENQAASRRRHTAVRFTFPNPHAKPPHADFLASILINVICLIKIKRNPYPGSRQQIRCTCVIKNNVANYTDTRVPEPSF